MKPFIEEICEYLADESDGSLTFGDGSSNLKIGELVRGSNGVFAVSSPAPEPDRYTPVSYEQIDFWARYSSTEDCYLILKTIYDLFHQNHHYETDNFHIFFSNATSKPEDLDRDLEGGKLMRLSILFIVRPLIS